MAITRFKLNATGEVYKFTSEEYEDRDGNKRVMHRVLLDQEDKVYTFNIKEELFNSVPRGTKVTLMCEYVEGSSSGAYMAVTNIVPFDDYDTKAPNKKPQEEKAAQK